MTSCPPDPGAEALSAYLEKALAPSEQAQIEAKLQQDPAVARELSQLQTMLAAMAQMPQVQAPRGFSERITKTIRRRRWLEDAKLHTQVALVFQIMSILVVVGIAAAYAIAQMENDDRRVLHIERGLGPQGSSPPSR